ncbi:MAG: hypothetical protein ACOYWZ_20270 [Bacillota bacterium]
MLAQKKTRNRNTGYSSKRNIEEYPGRNEVEKDHQVESLVEVQKESSKKINKSTCHGQTGPKNIPLELLIAYAERGLGLEEIAKLVGCCKSNVFYRLKAEGYTPERIQEFEKYHTKILLQKMSLLLQNLDQEKIKKMCGRDTVMSYGILFDKYQALTHTGLNQRLTDSIIINIHNALFVSPNKESKTPQDLVVESGK